MNKTVKNDINENDEVIQPAGEELKEEIIVHDDCQKSLEESENKFKRALADYQNLEKRVRSERLELIQSANRDLLLRFLPIFDTLLMAKQHSDDKNLSICLNQLKDTLKNEGVTKLEVEGESFEPEKMEVITTTPGKEGEVISEVRAGFLLHEALLRPAQVIVGNGEKLASSK